MAKLLLLFLSVTYAFFIIAHSARILDELVDPQPQVINNNPSTLGGVATTNTATTTLPTTLIPPATAATPAVPDHNVKVLEETPVVGAPVAAGAGDEDENADPPIPESTAAPIAISAPAAGGPETTEETPEQPQPAGTATPVVPGIAGTGNTAVASNAVVASKEPSLSFYMHDIIGGSHPSARVVAGIVANTDVTGLPFSKINNNLFPITGGIPLVNPKLNGIITNNNLPLLVGLNAAQSSTVFRNSGTSNTVTGSNNQPFVSAGNLPAGLTLQKLMFGSVTVIDDQITESHELDSTVIGKTQGFYLSSSLDGSSQTVVMTVIFHDHDQSGHHYEVEDSINLFGVHRSVSPGSAVAVIGGTGKYENAKGYAVLETLPNEDQHTTDGVDTIVHVSVYLTE